MIPDLPPYVRTEVQRILAAAARRLLADKLNGDAVGATTGGDSDPLDHGADEGAPLVQGQPVPVVNRDCQRVRRRA